MCGRFSIISKSGDVKKHFNLSRVHEFKQSFNVSPASDIPVIRLEDGERVLINMHWGLVPHWAKDTKIKPVNAKAETLESKPFFRSAFKKNRCLIPANGFYEWKRVDGHKQPYYFRLDNAELMAFAGLWDCREAGNELTYSCTIITTSANDVMKTVHDRMPVILEPGDYDAWLIEGDKSLLEPYTGELLAYPVSTIVNNPENDGKDLVEPFSYNGLH